MSQATKEMTVLRLEAAAAMCKVLAEDLKAGKLWEGDLQSGIADAIVQLSIAERDARRI